LEGSGRDPTDVISRISLRRAEKTMKSSIWITGILAEIRNGYFQKKSPERIATPTGSVHIYFTAIYMIKPIIISFRAT
jgi:hypothetical protein